MHMGKVFYYFPANISPPTRFTSGHSRCHGGLLHDSSASLAVASSSGTHVRLTLLHWHLHHIQHITLLWCLWVGSRCGSRNLEGKRHQPSGQIGRWPYLLPYPARAFTGIQCSMPWVARGDHTSGPEAWCISYIFQWHGVDSKMGVVLHFLPLPPMNPCISSSLTHHCLLLNSSSLFFLTHRISLDSSLLTPWFIIPLLSYSSHFTVTHLCWLTAIPCTI